MWSLGRSLSAGDVLGGDYRIEGPLAAGGMGAVYVARQISTNKRRALKLMHARLVPDVKSRMRFIQEAQVASHIDSEHVVEVVGAGVDDESGVPWIAMELLEGEDLHAMVSRQGALPVSEVRELIAQLGHALGAAHSAGIVHRDLKPENLFLARARRQGAERVLKVLDFGIATALPESERAAAVTSALGSPFWMSPEQAQRGALIRPATDVWPLGLIAFFLLTGRRYWRTGAFDPSEASAATLLAEILMDPLEPPSHRAAELGVSASLPGGFDDWFSHCVARNPEERFIEASAAVRALDAVLGGAPDVHRRAALGVADTAIAPAVQLPVHTPQPPTRSAPGHAPVRTQALPETTSATSSDPMPSPDPSSTASSGRGLWIASLGVLGVGTLALVAAAIIVMSGAPSEPAESRVPPAPPPSLGPDSPVPPPPESAGAASAVDPRESASTPIAEASPTPEPSSGVVEPEQAAAVPSPAQPRRARRETAPAAPPPAMAWPPAPSPQPAPLPAPSLQPAPLPAPLPAPPPAAPPSEPAPSPLPAPSEPSPPEPPATRTVEAGPLWNNQHANERCPGVCGGQGLRWTRQWWTTVQGRMSVCECTTQ